MRENECKIYGGSAYGDLVKEIALMPVVNRKTRECYRCAIPVVCLDRRVYRLKSARGLFTIHKAPGLDFSVWGMWDIAKRGTTIPRATVTPLRTFYILYNYARKPYKTGGNNNETA